MKHLKDGLSLLHSELRKNSYFKQVLFSYILISCITFLIFSIAILTIMQNEYSKDMERMNRHNIEQAYSFNTSVLSDISTYFYNSLDSATVRKLLYEDKYDVVTAPNARETYDEFTKISSMILSIDFINYKTDTVLTKTERCSLERFLDQGLLALLDRLTPRKTPYFCYPRQMPYNNGRTTEYRKVISMIYYSYYNGALVVNLDYDTYCSMLNMNFDNNLFRMILVNQNDLVMVSTDEEQFATDFADSPLYQKVLDTDSSEGTFIYEDEAGKYAVTYLKPPQMGLTYISMFSLQDQLRGAPLFMATFRYSIIYLVVTLLLSFLSSYIVYNPMKKLKTVIHPADSDISYIEHTHKNDFEFLESVYTQLIEKNTALSKFKRNYTEERQQKLLWLLMNSSGNLPLPRQDFEFLDSCFEYLNYLVFIISMEFDSSDQDMEKDIQLFKFTVKNVTTELFEDQLDLKCVDTVSPRLIFTGSLEHYDKQRLLATALQIQQFFHDTGLFRLSIGFGNPVTELENLSDAYDTAKTALINGHLNTLSCIQFYEDLQLAPPCEQQYPYETDQSIIAALKAQNVEACLAGVEEFFSIIQNFHYDQLRRAVLQLDAALQRFEYSNELPLFMAEGIDPDNQIAGTLKELKAIFQERCRTDIQALVEIRTHSLAKTELISDVNAFIEENIYNPNLSVAMIAEKVDLSINYLRNIYKENTGESLTAYIADKKLTLVCDMLSDTDIPIQDISDKLGFTTKNYFFTFFKKHMNMTPTQYRSMKQETRQSH